jgi:two-component system NarL family response regulator
MTTVIRVLIADDHPVVREGLAAILKASPRFDCVGQAEGVEEAIDLWQALAPDVGLFDLRMADGDAVSAISRIRRFDPDAKVLVVSSFDGDEEVYRSIRAGARGYLLKDSQPNVIAQAVECIAAGRRYLPADLSAKLADRVITTDLSPREIEIITLAAGGASNSSIAKRLSITVSTVKFHLNNVYSKLGVSSRTAAISAAYKRGIISIR